MSTRQAVGMLALAGILTGAEAGFALDNPAREEVGAALDIRQLDPAPVGRRNEPPQSFVLFDNGPLITHPTGGAGGLAASALQTALGMNIFGFGQSQAAGQRVADDFTVPAGATWRINSVLLYGYQTGAVPPTPTINSVNLRIWNGPPNNPASTVVFGDTTTNRLASSTWASIYRVTDTTLTNTQRAIYENAVTVGITLTAGTYWLDWQTGGSLASGPWAPPVTILGQTTTGNAMQFTGAWAPITDVGPQGLPFKLIGPDLTAMGLDVDAAGNGVLDPAETAAVAPRWRNDGPAALNNVTGALTNYTGPAGGTYTIVDGAAVYGTIAAGATQACTDCYSVSVTAATRPAVHWDSSVLETTSISGTTAVAKTWTLHIGGSFADVPSTNIFYRFIETLLHRDVTSGCTATDYCPGANTTREQMAVFVLVSKEGSGYNPPACVAPNLFSDVPDTSPFCKFIEELANRGVVTGCGPNLYCPTAPATREQMAVFVLRTLDPTLSPPPCVAGSEAFSDVPASSAFCPYVEELARRGIVTGCGGGAYCPTAPVTREQMAVFLSGTFSLTLYGVN